MKTVSVKPEQVDRNWVLVDAEGQVLGRLASRVAGILRGKGKPSFTPHVDCGDFVVVINADKIKVTGRKMDQKHYHTHSGYAGGIHSKSLREMLSKKPEEVIKLAVKGMLPKNRLNRRVLGKLKVYAGPEHPHEAQQPEKIEL
ncbi:MAG: 50S ribosomal protein L13 [bacterium]